MSESQMHDDLDRYLDGLTSGHDPGIGDGLASFARDLHARHGVTPLDADRRVAIWRELVKGASPGPMPTTGGAGPLSQPALLAPVTYNPWPEQRSATPERSTGWRHHRSTAQTALAIVTALALLVIAIGVFTGRDGVNRDPERIPTQLVAVPMLLPEPLQTMMGQAGTGGRIVPPTGDRGTESPNSGALFVPPTTEGTNDVTGTGDLIVPGPGPTGTPVPDDAWLAPITAAECVTREPRAGSDELPARAWSPFSTPSVEDAEDVAMTMRQYVACDLAGVPVQGYVSNRFNDKAPDSLVDIEAQAARGQEISEAYADLDRAGFIVMIEGPGMTPAPTMRITEGSGLYQPHHAMQLADGRIAIPMTHAYPGGFEAGRFPAFIGNVTVLVNVGGTWLIDEMLPFCIGECDDYWAAIQSPGTPPPATIATPGTVNGDGTVALVAVDDSIWRACPASNGPFTLGARTDTPASGALQPPWTLWQGPAEPPTIPCEIGWPPLPPGFEPVPLR